MQPSTEEEAKPIAHFSELDASVELAVEAKPSLPQPQMVSMQYYMFIAVPLNVLWCLQDSLLNVDSSLLLLACLYVHVGQREGSTSKSRVVNPFYFDQ